MRVKRGLNECTAARNNWTSSEVKLGGQGRIPLGKYVESIPDYTCACILRRGGRVVHPALDDSSDEMHRGSDWLSAV